MSARFVLRVWSSSKHRLLHQAQRTKVFGGSNSEIVVLTTYQQQASYREGLDTLTDKCSTGPSFCTCTQATVSCAVILSTIFMKSDSPPCEITVMKAPTKPDHLREERASPRTLEICCVGTSKDHWLDGTKRVAISTSLLSCEGSSPFSSPFHSVR